MSTWAKSIVETPVISIGGDLEEVLNQIAGKVAKKYRRYHQEFEAILLLPKFFHGFKNLVNVLLEYLFDEWLTEKEQEAVLRSGSDLAKIVGKENYLHVGSMEIFRFVNVKNGEIVYRRKDGQPLPKSVMDIIESSETDTVLHRRATPSEVGPTYGFITTKGGQEFVFKRGEPVKEGKKPTRGAECANVSETADKIKKLEQLIELYGKDKVSATVFGTIKNMNAFQLCTVTDIFLRVMDAQSFRGKRWFFRPVAAAASGHKGKA